MANDKIIEFKNLMVLASYNALTNFEAEQTNVPKQHDAKDFTTALDTTIEAISNQFAKQFEEELRSLAYGELKKLINS